MAKIPKFKHKITGLLRRYELEHIEAGSSPGFFYFLN